MASFKSIKKYINTMPVAQQQPKIRKEVALTEGTTMGLEKLRKKFKNRPTFKSLMELILKSVAETGRFDITETPK